MKAAFLELEIFHGHKRSRNPIGQKKIAGTESVVPTHTVSRRPSGRLARDLAVDSSRKIIANRLSNLRAVLCLSEKGDHMSSFHQRFSWKELLRPCPKPLEIAVEAGIFGVCADGGLRPSTDEVAAITEERACELLSMLCDLQHLDRCLKRHLNPHTGRPLHCLEIRQRIEASMEAGVAKLLQRYAAYLGVYADAFGVAGAETLDNCVRELIERPEFALTPIEIQKPLF